MELTYKTKKAKEKDDENKIGFECNYNLKTKLLNKMVAHFLSNFICLEKLQNWVGLSTQL